MVSPPLLAYTTSTAQSADSIVNHCVLFSIKLSMKKLKDFVASETDEKLFWKLINGQRPTSQMNTCYNGNLLTHKNKIREMWSDHFEFLGTPSDRSNFNNDFCHRVTSRVHVVLKTCIEDPSGALCEPLGYEEVAHVCSRWKPGVTSISIDYEHICYAVPLLWKALFCLYRGFFESSSVCEILKTGIILPLFKGKGAKASNKDNYRGITLFPTICKVYEMIPVNRLEKFASQK